MRKIIKTAMMIGASFLCVAVAVVTSVTNDYSWENGGTILDRYGNLSNELNVSVGSDPGTNSNDYFCVSSMSNLPPVTLYFESSSNRLYTMIGCSNLVSGTWMNVSGTGPRDGVGGADAMQDTNVPAQGPYYRLEVKLP